MRAEDLRQISKDSMPDEKIEAAMKSVKDNMMAAAKQGERSVFVVLPMNVADVVYERLERDDYQLMVTKGKGSVKLKISW